MKRCLKKLNIVKILYKRNFKNIINFVELLHMKVLVTGANGQLGSDVVNELRKRNHEVVSTDISGNMDYLLDITKDSIIEEVKKINPDAIIHCAAWTAVDAAEDEENKEKVYNINVIGTKNLVEAAKDLDCKFLYLSTDYVFNGKGENPWKPDDKNYEPLNYYGETKLKGELEVNKLNKYFIVRIAWVFGLNGKNFIQTMINVGKTHNEVRVVNDQIGTPTYTYDLSRLLVDMIESDKYGYYHATNEGGYISWYDFCVEIYKQANMNTKVIPVSTEEYGLSKAKRPFNSRLDKSKLSDNGFVRLPDYKDALSRFLKEKYGQQE